MKIIKVRDDFDPPSGQEYAASTYPGDGAYEVRRLNLVMFVQNGVVYSQMIPSLKLEPELEPVISEGRNDDLVLKAIAVALQPVLIKDIIQKS